MSRQRGISTLGSILIAGVAGLVTATAIMDWVVVDVRTPEPENMRIVVPFPLILADVATAFIPDEARSEMAVPEEVRAQRDVVMAALRGLEDLPECTLVEVRTPEERVNIRAKNRSIVVDVVADGDTVHCSLPVKALSDSLDRWDWKVFEPKIALRALHRAPAGVLVDVNAGDGTKVKITKW